MAGRSCGTADIDRKPQSVRLAPATTPIKATDMHCLLCSAMHAYSGRADTADDRTAATSTMTYCQAVLWIRPLLAVIEKANNQLTGIRKN